MASPPGVLLAGGEHLVVLGFFHAFEHQPLHDLLVFGFVLLGRLKAGVAHRFAGVAGQAAGDDLVLQGRVGKVFAAKLGATEFEVFVRYVVGGASVDDGELAGASDNRFVGDFGGGFAVTQDTAGLVRLV